MNGSDDISERVDRRTALGAMATAALAGVGAGCLGDDGERTSTPSPTAQPTEFPTDEPTPSSEYEVEIEPTGSLPLDEPPTRWIGGRDFSVDVGLCLGELDSLVGMVRPDDVFTEFYETLDGVEIDLSSVTDIEPETHQINKELVYELDPDVLAVDPNQLVVHNGLEPSDLDELERNVAPFFGNYSREQRGRDWPNWPDGEYGYYDYPELLQKYAELFDKADRMAEIITFRERILAEITERIPPESERPRVALLLSWPNPEGRGGAYFLYNTRPQRDDTYGRMQYRQLGAREAFDDEVHETGATARVGHEAMAEADPDVIVFNFGLDQADNAAETAEVLRNSPVADEISAVQDDRLYLGGTPYQGPITSLFQLEMLAKQLYPDEFGEFHGVGEIPDDEQLFDRDRLVELLPTD